MCLSDDEPRKVQITKQSSQDRPVVECVYVNSGFTSACLCPRSVCLRRRMNLFFFLKKIPEKIIYNSIIYFILIGRP